MMDAQTDSLRDRLLLACCWLQVLGAEVSIDDVGNMYGRLAGTDDGLTPVVLGSHLDSVVEGGRFDGALGVLAALESLRSICNCAVRSATGAR